MFVCVCVWIFCASLTLSLFSYNLYSTVIAIDGSCCCYYYLVLLLLFWWFRCDDCVVEVRTHTHTLTQKSASFRFSSLVTAFQVPLNSAANVFYCCCITVLLFIRALGNIFTFVKFLPHTTLAPTCAHTFVFVHFFRITFITLVLLLLLLFSCLHLVYHPLPAVIERNSRAKETINACAKVGRHRYLRRFFADSFIVFIVVAIVDMLVICAKNTRTWAHTLQVCDILASISL